MSVIALKPGYQGEVRDRVENFHGNQLVYFGWDQHLLFCSAFAAPLPPSMPFGIFVEQVVKPILAAHPEAERIDWSQAQWLRSSQPFTPDWDKSLIDNGIGHKTALRIRTPGLNGLEGSCS